MSHFVNVVSVLLVSFVQGGSTAIARTIENAGLRVLHVVDARSALWIFSRVRVDVVLLDLNHVDSTSMELLSRIRELPDGHAVSVLALIGPLTTPGLGDIEGLDVTDYLIKPVNSVRLVESILRYLPISLDCHPDPEASS